MIEGAGRWVHISMVLGAAALGILIPYALNGEMPSTLGFAPIFLFSYAAGYFVIGTCLGIRIPTYLFGVIYVELGRLGCALFAVTIAGVGYLIS